MIPNKHQQKTAATRRKLLQAGMRVFSRDGFEAARIEDIASAAGHTRGAFYANFEGKEDLFFALLEQQIARRKQEVIALMNSAPTREEAVRVLREFYLKRAADRQWAMLGLEFKLFALRHGRLRAKLAAAHRRIRSSLGLRSMCDAKLLPSDFPEMYKVTLEAALAGLVVEHAYDPQRITPAQVQEVLGQIFDLLLPPK
jgi:AcrR family transcriptional regulator